MYDAEIIGRVITAAGDAVSAGEALFGRSNRVRLTPEQAQEASLWRATIYNRLEARCAEHGISVIDVLQGFRKLPLSDEERIYKQGWLQGEAAEHAVDAPQPSHRFDGPPQAGRNRTVWRTRYHNARRGA